jgi:peptidoglycan/xylan/chitin deacetylase (PgdA/CDA1 family)
MFSRTDRESVATWAHRIGLTPALSLLAKRSCLLVVNFHRIGECAKTPYDPGTFSATADEFYDQIGFLKSRFEIAGMEHAIAYAEGRRVSRRPLVLLTFDDGYRDNYEEALPVLRAHDVEATFFLPTSYIATHRIPWWDAMAYQIRHSGTSKIRLSYPEEMVVEVDPRNPQIAVKRVLSIYKSPGVDPSRFREEVTAATGVEEPLRSADRLFMTWTEVKELIAAGMTIGSHTHSHRLLSGMTCEEQLDEFLLSRAVIEENAGVRVESLAFPVGSRTSFSRDTCKLLQEAGYRAGFSFFGGTNVPGRIDPFNIRRFDGDLDEGRAFFELRTTLAAVAGRELL